MRILILNWRDIRNPRAGGAEVLTHEIAKRLVERGDEVVWFTSQPDDAAPEDDVDGVRIVRRGSELTTRFYAPAFARHSQWDVLVEEINTLPYLTPLWSQTRSLLVIPQLARDVWWHEAPPALAALGYLAEPLYLSPYRRTECVTISNSTVSDLRAVGVRAPIHVIPMASSSPALASLPPKTPSGRLAIVGRLVPSKRVDHAIRALSAVRRDVPAATLDVVGTGPELQTLQRLAFEVGVADYVDFHGRTSEERKQQLLEEADVLVACAVREGWGLTVTEAARAGTPSVCYRVPGLRDAVIDGRTGVLTDEDPAALAAAIRALLERPSEYEVLRRNAWRHNAELSWARTAAAFATVLSPDEAYSRSRAAGRA